MLPNNFVPGVPQAPIKVIVVFFGMTASGKSTLGKAWAKACQGTYHNTDRVRKELAGLQPTDKRPDQVTQGIYSTAFTERTYQALLECARNDFAHGYEMVVLDGSYSKRQERDRVRSLAGEIGARCVFIFCTCSDNEVQRRLDQRALDPEAVSDGRWEIYQHQKTIFEPPDINEERACVRLSTEQSVGELLAFLAANPLFQDCTPQ